MRHAVIALVAACTLLAGVALGTHTGTPTTTAVASVSTDDLQAQIDTLKRQVLLIYLANLGVPDRVTSVESRVSTVERQVGVGSINRNSLSNLWDEVAKVERYTGTDGFFTPSPNLSSELSSITSCLRSIQSSWRSSYGPSCYL